MTTIYFQCRAATDAERNCTVEQLKIHTETATGCSIAHEPFGLFGYEVERLVCSIVGKIFLGWLHLDLVWVDDAFRGRGIGRHSMERVTAAAGERGLSGIEVWTQSWQAPGFYRKCGYEEFAVLDDFIPGQKRYAFRRYLKEDARP